MSEEAACPEEQDEFDKLNTLLYSFGIRKRVQVCQIQYHSGPGYYFDVVRAGALGGLFFEEIFTDTIEEMKVIVLADIARIQALRYEKGEPKNDTI